MNNKEKAINFAKNYGIDIKCLQQFFKESNESSFFEIIEIFGFSDERIQFLFENQLETLIILNNISNDSYENMKTIINYFGELDLREYIIRIYFGMANIVRENPSLELKIAKIISDFNSNAVNSNKGGLSQFLKIIRLLKLQKEFETNYAEYPGIYIYNDIIIDQFLIKLILKISNASYNDYDFFKYKNLLEDFMIGNDNEYTIDKMALHYIDGITTLLFEDIDILELEALYEILYSFDYDGEINSNIIDETKNNIEVSEKREHKSLEIQPKNIDFKKLEKELTTSIVGQEKAIKEVVDRLEIAEFGISKESGAKSVMMFIGPTGVGKTAIAKLISQNQNLKLIRIDMGEYKESHQISKIIGSPPGYIGYTTKNESDDPTVFGKIKENPDSIILLDEIEKGHPDILDLFLHIFDEGVAKTNKQEEINFSNNTFILTSNVGVKEFQKSTIGFNDVSCKEESYFNALKKQFKPEFLNRIDKIILFQNLNYNDAIIIIDKLIKQFEQKIYINKNVKISFVYEIDVLNFLISKCQIAEYGAREIRRIVEEYLIYNLIKLNIKIYEECEIVIKLEKEQLSLNMIKSKIKQKH